LALLMTAGGVSAQDVSAGGPPGTTAWLEVTPGVSCLERARLEALVAMWLGRATVSTTARVRVAGDPRLARVVEVSVDREGVGSERRFDPVPAGCDEAHAAVSLVIALAIEPAVVDDVLGLSELPDQGAPVEIALTAQLAGATALLPNWSLGGAFGMQAWFAPWLGARIELLAQHARNNTVGDTNGLFDATLIATDVRACAGGKPGAATRIALCTGAALGALHARGRSYEQSYSPTGFWLGITSGLRLELQAGLPWLLDIAAVLPLHDQPFTVAREGDGEIAREPSSAALLIGLGSKLPL
jgi:hypothetical protein